MIKKIGGFLGSFLEAHVEKIILIVIGLLCSWLLITRVLLTPNTIEYRGETYSPGSIDTKIEEKYQDVITKPLSDILPDINPPDGRNYVELLASPLSDIDFDFPGRPGLPPFRPDSIYDEPDIAMIQVSDVDIEHMRTVVYEPTVEVTKNRTYDNGYSEPNDLDLITVSGYIDIAEIVQEFERCYKHVDTPDPCKAKPIFASVNLQRRSINEDGSWSNWGNVSRTKIDYNRDLFKVVNSYSDLPIGGIEVYKYRLNDIVTQLELLQPESYYIASANEEWFPPEFHRDFVDAQKKDEREEKRQDTTSTRSATDSGRRGTTRGTTAGGVGSTRTGTTSRRGSSGGRRGNTNANSRTDTRTDTRTDSRRGINQNDTYVEEVYEEFESVVLTDETDIKSLTEPILIWAQDDTAEPDNTYQYRIRVGLLNPNAQKENDDIILWTDFSETTPEVYIPGKIYFFANEVQEAAKTVSVSVYKLALGKWYKKVYDRVALGEMIGDIEENIIEEEDDEDDTGRITDTSDEPETIDFRTGAILVDLVRASGLTGGSSMNPMPYYDMLYSYGDGEEILHMPVIRTPNQNIMSEVLYDAYRYVQSHINDDREPFKTFGSAEVDVRDLRSGLQSRGRRF